MHLRTVVGAGPRTLRLVRTGHGARVRVAIVSDVRVVRDGLTGLLASEPTLTTVLTASAQEVGLLSERECDVVLLDAGTVAPERVSPVPDVSDQRMVAFGLTPRDHDAILRCARSGVRVFVSSDALASDLVEAIHAAARNEVMCPPELAHAIIHGAPRAARDDSRHGRTMLTPRESDIVTLVGRGLSNKQIAGALNIALSTVKNHVHSILIKLHTRGRKEAAALSRCVNPSTDAART